MRLRDLLPTADAASGEIQVTGITADSRRVRPGFVFVAIPGNKADGLQFITQAAAAGAIAVLTVSTPAEMPRGVALIQTSNVRRALALAAARFYPRQPATIAAVTGTSGKTSVAAFTRQIWATLGQAAASVGTVGVVSPKGEIYGSLTTPDPVDLHRTLNTLADEGVTHLALEASSHGLDQHRLDGVKVTAAGFTNLSRDHLDYHPTLEAYLDAKLRLFRDLVIDGGAAVISADHAESAQVIAAAKARHLRVLTVGRAGEAIALRDVEVAGFTQKLNLHHAGQEFTVRLPLVGAFQIENALVAAGLVIATGSKPADVFAALERLQGAKGRLEFAGAARGAPIFIDYAHKPDALAKALESLRPYVTGKLVVVFGAGGDRDAGKRPLMGEIAARLADSVIVTDDNPRSETPENIRAAILAAAPGAVEIGDRAEAIRTAIGDLRQGDVLLIAGKGHETGQIVGDRTLPFSDHDAVAAVLKEFER